MKAHGCAFSLAAPRAVESQAGLARQSVCSGSGMSLTKGISDDQRIKALKGTQNILINEKVHHMCV